jgi:hypothetical protein
MPRSIVFLLAIWPMAAIVTFANVPAAAAPQRFTEHCHALVSQRDGDAVNAQRTCSCVRKYVATSIGQQGHDRLFEALAAAGWRVDDAAKTGSLEADRAQVFRSAALACGY